VWARRLDVQYLARPARGPDLVEVVRAVGGIHAQVMASAEVAIGLRVDGATRRDVADALWERRTLVKTHGIRGTVRLFPADELPLWLAALRARAEPGAGGAAFQPDARTRRVIDAIAAALDGACLTRDELGEEVGRRVGAWALEKTFPAFGDMWPFWTQMIGPAAAAGALCFGRNRGNRVTFVRPDQWIGSWTEVDPAAALAEALRRYLGAFGPARPEDFARWFTMDERATKRLVASLGDQIEEVDVEGWRALQLRDEPSRPEPAGGPARSVWLLPQFDEYVIGSHPRERLVPADFRDRLADGRVDASWARRAVSTGAIAMIPTLLVDGIVSGVWQRRRERKRLDVRVEPILPLTGEQQHGLEAAARRVGEIVEADVNLALGRVDVRPHL